MIEIASAESFSVHGEQVAAMHRLRHRVFRERLGWDVTSSGGMEVDEYDLEYPTYILYTSDEAELTGCVRLLPTTGPYMLKDTFPTLAGDREAPRSPRIWEASRFAVEQQRRCGGRPLSAVTATLFASMVEFGLDKGLTSFVAVVDVRMERILRIAGWPLQRFTAPQAVGITPAVAGFLDISSGVLATIRCRGKLTNRPLLFTETRTAA